MESLSVSVIIPAYNEERNIDEVLSRTHKAMGALNLPYEVIVVDDGSTDRTRFLAERYKVTVISNGTNRGKGYALQKGVNSACGSLIITMDADGSHNPEEICRLVEPLKNGADVVMGSRFVGKSGKNSTKRLHIFGNMLFNLLIKILTQKSVTDSQTGFRGFKRKVLEEIKIASRGYSIETELTVKSLKNGYAVREECITFDKRKSGQSHLNPLMDGFAILKTMVVAGLCVKEQK